MKHTRLAYIPSIVMLVACTSPDTFQDEQSQSVSEAVASTGVTATLNLPTPSSGKFQQATLVVTNNTKTTMSNWQVVLSATTGTSIKYQQTSGGENVVLSSSLYAFDPQAASLAPGASQTVTFNGLTTGTTNYLTIASVDGDANGAAGANWPNDGVDHIARAAASGAVQLLVAYENNKLPNVSPADASYAVYDGLLLAAHMYTLNATYDGIIFDPNAPGYAFIPSQAFAALAALQNSPEVASYLAVGLQSCFANTNGSDIYTIKAAPFKGYTNAGTSTWTTTPGGLAGTTDSYTIAVAPDPSSPGADLITLNLKTSSGDTRFGAAYVTPSASPLISSAVSAKFTTVQSNHGTGGGQSAACTPFNGPGGSANPHFIVGLSKNGGAQTTSPAYLQNQPTNCSASNTCTASLTIDPLPYQTPPASASTLGAQSNPFQVDATLAGGSTAITTYKGSWAWTRNSAGSTVYGTFSSPVQNMVNRVPTITGYAWVPSTVSDAGGGG